MISYDCNAFHTVQNLKKIVTNLDKNIKKNYQIKFEVFNALFNASPKETNLKFILSNKLLN